MGNTTTGYHDNVGIGVTPDLTAADIARVCHEANRAWCELHGDTSQVPFLDAPEWQKQSAVNGVLAIHEGRVREPRDSHAGWMKEKFDAGWIFGPVKDPEKKEHPCLVPYDQLPLEQRVKDLLFFAIASALLRQAPVVAADIVPR